MKALINLLILFVAFNTACDYNTDCTSCISEGTCYWMPSWSGGFICTRNPSDKDGKFVIDSCDEVEQPKSSVGPSSGGTRNQLPILSLPARPFPSSTAQKDAGPNFVIDEIHDKEQSTESGNNFKVSKRDKAVNPKYETTKNTNRSLNQSEINPAGANTTNAESDLEIENAKRVLQIRNDADLNQKTVNTTSSEQTIAISVGDPKFNVLENSTRFPQGQTQLDHNGTTATDISAHFNHEVSIKPTEIYPANVKSIDADSDFGIGNHRVVTDRNITSEIYISVNNTNLLPPTKKKRNKLNKRLKRNLCHGLLLMRKSQDNGTSDYNIDELIKKNPMIGKDELCRKLIHDRRVERLTNCTACSQNRFKALELRIDCGVLHNCKDCTVHCIWAWNNSSSACMDPDKPVPSGEDFILPGSGDWCPNPDPTPSPTTESGFYSIGFFILLALLICSFGGAILWILKKKRFTGSTGRGEESTPLREFVTIF